MTEALDALLADAQLKTEASLVARLDVAAGGVDPLGLRQINFDLMDRVIPGLNNVARHVRPFTFMAWSWRRARQVIGAKTVETHVVKNFVDRLETVFAWSQFLVDDGADLPGSQALLPLLRANEYKFDGEAWEQFRDVRRYSTGIAAPVNYGPALRSMHWVGDSGKPGVFKPNPDFEPMLSAFESSFANELEHPLFNSFKSVTVSREEAQRWGECWRLLDLSALERAAAYEALCGNLAPIQRRAGVGLIQAAAAQSSDLRSVRRLMAEPTHASFASAELSDAASEWRGVQVRQVFRLALESLLRWLCLRVVDQPATTEELADQFLGEVFGEKARPASTMAWLASVAMPSNNPVDRLEALETAIHNDQAVEQAVAESLLYCLSTYSADPDVQEAVERLPLWRARAEFDPIAHQDPRAWICHVIEAWVLAQHLFWSVGRGLADARGGGKTLLRLRVTMEEGGWKLLPGASAGSKPEATPDRLATVMSLLRECGQLEVPA
jgi:hypothetical protein